MALNAPGTGTDGTAPERAQPERAEPEADPAVTLIRAGHHRAALAHLDATLAADPDDHAARYHRGMAHRQLGSFAEAFADLDIAVQTIPDHRDSRIERALVALDVNEPGRAVTDLDVVIANDPSDRAAPRLRRRAIRAKRSAGPVARTLGAVVFGFLVGAVFVFGGLAAIAIVAVFLASLAIHELGHVAAAQRSGLPVAGLWLGVGPRLIWGQRAVTGQRLDYGLRLLPLGAYVRLRRHEDTPDLWRRHLGFFAAGPAANLVLAGALGAVAAGQLGVPNTDLTIADVEVRGIARLAGVQAGDRLIGIDESPVRTVPAAMRAIGGIERDEVIQLDFQRGNTEPFALAISGADRRLLGLGLGPATIDDPSIGQRLGSWWRAIWRPEDLVGDPALSSLDQIRNPLGLFRSTDAVTANPWAALLVIAIAWNGPIGLLNLVPIPPFDGGQMVRLLVRRSRRGSSG